MALHVGYFLYHILFTSWRWNAFAMQLCEYTSCIYILLFYGQVFLFQETLSLSSCWWSRTKIAFFWTYIQYSQRYLPQEKLHFAQSVTNTESDFTQNVSYVNLTMNTFLALKWVLLFAHPLCDSLCRQLHEWNLSSMNMCLHSSKFVKEWATTLVTFT